MLKRVIYLANLIKDRPISREELTEITLKDIESTESKLAEFRVKALTAYAKDHHGEIAQYAGLWGSYRITLGGYKADLKALQSPGVEGRFSYERMRRRYAKQNLVELPLDFEMEQAKRAYEQRVEEAEEWLDNHFSPTEQMERLLSGRNYAGCPIGNFETVEQYYQAMKE